MAPRRWRSRRWSSWGLGTGDWENRKPETGNRKPETGTARHERREQFPPFILTLTGSFAILPCCEWADVESRKAVYHGEHREIHVGCLSTFRRAYQGLQSDDKELAGRRLVNRFSLCTLW